MRFLFLFSSVLWLSTLLGAADLFVVGKTAPGIRKVTAAETATTSDSTILADATAAAFTETLPSSPYAGEILNVKKIDSTSNAITVSGNGHTIDGQSTVILSTQYTNVQLQFDGSVWWLL